MAKAKLLSQEDMKRQYKLDSGKIITLKIDEELEEVTFWDVNNNQLGNDRDFLFIEDEDRENRFLLGRMYVPIKNNGLGRAAVEFFKEYTDSEIYARENDGITRDDGSHLTEDAPGFVHKLQEEGLIEKFKG
jgi:hypothetical protein